MQIAVEKAVDGLIAFMADHVATIPKDIDRWKGFALLGMLKFKPRATADAVKPMLEKLGLVRDDKIELEAVKAALDMAFEKVPEVEFFNFKFDSNDVKTLIDKMRGVASGPVNPEVQA